MLSLCLSTQDTSLYRKVTVKYLIECLYIVLANNILFHFFRVSEVENVAYVVCSLLKKEPSVYWLMFILTCNEACDKIFLKSSVVSIIINILCRFDLNSITDHKRAITYLTALVRSLGNLCGQRSCAEELMKNYCEQPYAVELLLTNLLTSKYAHIQRETIWFMGNLFRNCEHSQALASKLETPMRSALHILNQSNKFDNAQI